MIIYRLVKFMLGLIMPVMEPLFSLGDIVFLWDWVPDFLNDIRIVFYLVPVYDLIPLIHMIIMISVLRILVALVRFIFDAIPLY